MNERRRDFDRERFTQALHDRASGRGAVGDAPYRTSNRLYSGKPLREFETRWSLLTDWVRDGLDDVAIAVKWAEMSPSHLDLAQTLGWVRSALSHPRETNQ
jgi:hypothetical protein